MAKKPIYAVERLNCKGLSGNRTERTNCFYEAARLRGAEQGTRKFAIRTKGYVFVYTGSIGNAGSIGVGKVVVPEYLFKLLYDEFNIDLGLSGYLTSTMPGPKALSASRSF